MPHGRYTKCFWFNEPCWVCTAIYTLKDLLVVIATVKELRGYDAHRP